MKRFLLLLTASVILFGSCANYKNINVGDVSIKDAKMVSMTKYEVELEVEVDNPTRSAFVVRDAEGLLLKSGEPFADVVVTEEVKIPARGVNKVGIKCDVSLRNALSALAIGLNYKSLDWDEFAVDAKAVVKSGAIKKKKEFRNVPLKKLYNYIKRKR